MFQFCILHMFYDFLTTRSNLYKTHPKSLFIFRENSNKFLSRLNTVLCQQVLSIYVD